MTDLRRGPRSWLDSLLGICLTILAAAIALHAAVGLVERDWPWLAGGFAVVVLIGAVAALLRSRRRGW